MAGTIPTDIIKRAMDRAQADLAFVKKGLELVLPAEPEGTYIRDTVEEAIETVTDLDDLIRDLRFPNIEPTSRIIKALQLQAADAAHPSHGPPASKRPTIDESTPEPGEPATVSA